MFISQMLKIILRISIILFIKKDYPMDFKIINIRNNFYISINKAIRSYPQNLFLFSFH